MSTDDMLMGDWCPGPVRCQALAFSTEESAHRLTLAYQRSLERAQNENIALELALVTAHEQLREKDETIARLNDKLRRLRSESA